MSTETPPVAAGLGLTPAAVKLGVLVLIGVAYLPILSSGFVLDDGWTFVSNGFLRYPGHLPVLLEGRGAELAIPDPFRPLLVAFDALTYHWLGLDARMHHLLSLVLHLGVCLTLDRLLARLEAPDVVRHVSMATFGLLGIHAEAISVISYREDLLAALLGIAAITLATADARHARRERAARLALAALCMFAALGAKLSAAPLPAAAWLLWSWPRWRALPPMRQRVVGVLALTLGVLLGLALRWKLTGQLLPYTADDPRTSWWLSQGASAPGAAALFSLRALSRTLLPVGLAPEYSPAIPAAGTLTYVVALTFVSGCLVGAALWRWRQPRAILPVIVLGWAALWLPTSNLIPLPNPEADRYAYLPSFMVCVGLGAFASAVLARANGPLPRRAVGAAIALFLIVHGSLGLTASRSYFSNITLWETSTRLAPRSARAHAMHGIVNLSRLDLRPVPDPELLDATRESCETAHQLNARDAHPHLCMARLALVEKRWADAERHLGDALDRAPVRRAAIDAARLEVLPDALFDLPEHELRDLVLRRSTALLRAAPYAPSAFEAVGRTLHRMGLDLQAGMAYRAAHHRRPERFATQIHRLELALDRGDLQGAWTLWNRYAAFRGLVHESERTALNARLESLRRFPGAVLVPSRHLTGSPIGP